MKTLFITTLFLSSQSLPSEGWGLCRKCNNLKNLIPHLPHISVPTLYQADTCGIPKLPHLSSAVAFLKAEALAKEVAKADIPHLSIPPFLSAQSLPPEGWGLCGKCNDPKNLIPHLPHISVTTLYQADTCGIPKLPHLSSAVAFLKAEALTKADIPHLSIPPFLSAQSLPPEGWGLCGKCNDPKNLIPHLPMTSKKIFGPSFFCNLPKRIYA